LRSPSESEDRVYIETLKIVKKEDEQPPAHGEYCDCAECERERQQARLECQRERPEELLTSWCVPQKHILSSFMTCAGGEAVKRLCSEAAASREDVLLCGKTGCGKTHLAVAMMAQAVENHHKILRGKIPPFGLFVTVPELLLSIRSSFRKNGGDDEDSEAVIVDRYSSVGLLILDDLGAEKASDWAESTLYLIIDRRNRDEKWTIVTSNLTLPEIEQHMGARIASRLSDMKVVNIKLPDHRKKR
jgi:DNA replication protein DnaC